MTSLAAEQALHSRSEGVELSPFRPLAPHTAVLPDVVHPNWLGGSMENAGGRPLTVPVVTGVGHDVVGTRTGRGQRPTVVIVVQARLSTEPSRLMRSTRSEPV